jgi:hypothetical protein
MASLMGPDYLGSPTAGGAISGKAAQLFAEEGARLTKRIEEQAVINEAKAKAPILATAYAEGLTRIANGDMSGFEAIARTEAESVGNPFLMQMTRSASSEGARMASNIFQQRSQQAMLDRQVEQNKALLDRQREDDWRAGQLLQQKNYEKEVATYEQDQQAEIEKARIEGRQPRQLPKPQPPASEPPPSPTSRSYGGTVSTGLEGDLPSGGATTTPEAMPGTPAYKMAQAGTDNQTNQLMAGDEIVNEAMQTSAPAESSIEGSPKPAPETLVNENSKASPPEGIELGVERPPEQLDDDRMVIPFGRANFYIKSPATKKMKVVKTINDSTGSTAYTIQSGEDADNPSKLAETISKIASMDHELTQWASARMREKQEVTIEPNPNDPKAPWIAKANGVPMQMENPEASKVTEKEAKEKGIQNTIIRPIAPEIGELWAESRSLFNQAKGQVGVDYPLTKEEVGKVHEDQKSKILAGSLTLKEANEYNKKKGLKALSENDLTSPAKPSMREASPEVMAELKKKGVKMPDDGKKPEAKEDIKSLNAQLNQLKKLLPTKPEVWNDIVSVQEKISALEKKQDEDDPSFNQFGIPTGTGIKRGLKAAAGAISPFSIPR